MLKKDSEVATEESKKTFVSNSPGGTEEDHFDYELPDPRKATLESGPAMICLKDDPHFHLPVTEHERGKTGLRMDELPKVTGFYRAKSYPKRSGEDGEARSELESYIEKDTSAVSPLDGGAERLNGSTPTNSIHVN